MDEAGDQAALQGFFGIGGIEALLPRARDRPGDVGAHEGESPASRAVTSRSHHLDDGLRELEERLACAVADLANPLARNPERFLTGDRLVERRSHYDDVLQKFHGVPVTAEGLAMKSTARILILGDLKRSGKDAGKTW